MKTKSIILRTDEKFDQDITLKSKLLGTTKSSLIRESAYGYWPSEKYDPDVLLNEYASNPDEIVSLVSKYIRRHGYPHSKLSPIQLAKEMIKLNKTKSPLLDNNLLQSNTVGLNMANHFHSHMSKVKTGKYRTPYEQFADDGLLEDAIKRLFELNKKPTMSNIRRMLKTRDGVKCVVNFKPAIAAFIYQQYCPPKGHILDPCAGFGGRLTGCIASNLGFSYTGIDPNGKTHIGNSRLAAFYASLYEDGKRQWDFDYSSLLGCAEDIMPRLNAGFDVIFTSPPFFDVEKYSKDPNQSYLRYPTYTEWKEQFLRVIIRESKRLLKEGSFLILNLKNYRDKKIADDAVAIAHEYGLNLIKTYQMKLANLEYGLRKEQKWHSEPIFVWQKPGRSTIQDINPDTLNLCKEAVKAMDSRKDENINEWAERLANDVANAND